MSLTFHLIPHTHWDREWYLPRAAFQARLIPVLDDVLEQLERDPAARFLLDGQTILLEDYLAVRPRQEPRVAAQVERGALEIGPWYVLSDLLIPSAQSLRKNLEEGNRQASRFGRRLDVLYSPDAFGHPALLPRLAAEFGIRRAVIRRGLGRPGDFYRWEAPGGESLLAYQLPASGYDAAVTLTEPGANLARRWPAIRRELVERAATDQIAVFLGADHHAMVGDVSALRTRLQQLEPDHEVRISGLTEFFDAVERNPPDVPIVRGELRRSGGQAWVLQDVHSTRSRMKRSHGAAELLLSRIAEPLARLATESTGPDRSELVAHAWRTLLQCQFHDTLAGTTGDAAQREQLARLEAVEVLGREIAEAGLNEVAGYDPDYAREHPDQAAPRLLLWNPAAQARGGVMTAELSFFRSDVLVGPPGGRKARVGPGYRPFALETGSGEVIPVQLLGIQPDQERRDATRHYPVQCQVDRVWIGFRAPLVPGLGTSLLSPRSSRQAPPPEELVVEPGLLANRFVSVRVAPTGILTVTQPASGTSLPGLLALVDEPDRGDLYTFSRGPEPIESGGNPVSQVTHATGPLVGAVETRWTMRAARGGTLDLRLLVTLHADSRLVRLRLDIENGGHDHRLRARFPVEPGRALAGAPVGVEPREPVDKRPDLFEREVATAPAHRFVAAVGHRKGLTVFAPGFFEAEWTRKGELVVTLLRARGQLSRADLPERPGHAAWPMPTPAAQEEGKHTIELGLAPLGAEELAEPDRLERMWEDLFLPLQGRYLPDFCSK